MKFQDFINNQIAPLDIPISKKENIMLLLRDYDLSGAQQIITSCISKEINNQNMILSTLLLELDKHIERFNDDLEADEISYND